MNAWLVDEDGQLLAIYSMGKLRYQPGADRDKVLLLLTRMFGEAMSTPQQMVYGGGHRYYETAYGTGGNAGLS